MSASKCNLTGHQMRIAVDLQIGTREPEEMALGVNFQTDETTDEVMKSVDEALAAIRDGCAEFVQRRIKGDGT